MHNSVLNFIFTGEANDVSITTINLTAIEIITNFSNSSYSISLNCSSCQYSFDNVSVTIVTGLCPETLYTVSIADDNELIAQCVTIYTGSKFELIFTTP